MWLIIQLQEFQTQLTFHLHVNNLITHVTKYAIVLVDNVIANATIAIANTTSLVCMWMPHLQ
jgi:hypothetical protein